MLRNATLRALEEMSAAARAEGVTLLVSSTYRSYEYQTEVFGRNVREMGRAEAEMVSAMPGHSQHQLGTAIDFGSITDAFAETKASRWLANNARRFGFSLSFPKGLTEVTGYKWESWHYRLYRESRGKPWKKTTSRAYSNTAHAFPGRSAIGEAAGGSICERGCPETRASIRAGNLPTSSRRPS